jgi:putative sporulation protein YtxC
MKSLTIVMRNLAELRADDWFDSLGQKLMDVHKHQPALQMKCDRYEKFSIMQFKVSEKIEQALSSVLADYIISIMESVLLLDLIKREFHVKSSEDIQIVEQYCKQFLQGSKASLNSISLLLNNRHAYISQRIAEYFKDHQKMVVEGFVRFRLQEYVEELRMLVELAIDESMLDRQYQEFISLLQYFVYMQETKLPEVHLIHKGGHEFLIFDNRLDAIDMKEFDGSFKMEVLDQDINFEDMIVSTLITVAPATIRIHTREPELLIIKTIMQIFEGRTSLCSYCLNCRAYLGELPKKDQLYP